MTGKIVKLLTEAKNVGAWQKGHSEKKGGGGEGLAIGHAMT